MSARDEVALVDSWRFESFARMGFTGEQIPHLLAWKSDLHATEDLIRSGCSHELALAILQPDDDPVVLAATV